MSASRHVVEHLHQRAQAVAVRDDQHVAAGLAAPARCRSFQYGSTRASVSLSDSVAGSSRGRTLA